MRRRVLDNAEEGKGNSQASNFSRRFTAIGFQGYQLLSNAETGKVMIISFWETCEQMEQVAQGTEAGIHDEGIQTTGLTSLHLETYEVKLQA